MSEAFEQWRSKSTRDRAKVTICFDRALLHELEQVEENLRDAKVGRAGMLLDDQTAELRDRAERLRESIKEKSRTLVFESIGRRAWRSLQSEHPPTDAQLKELAGREVVPQFNPETFPIAAMVATCVEPGLTEEQARWMYEELPELVFGKVWNACLTANVTGGRDPFDPVSVTHDSSSKRSRRPSSSASPAASS